METAAVDAAEAAPPVVEDHDCPARAEVTLELSLPRADAARVGRAAALAQLRIGRSRVAPVAIEWRATPDGGLSDLPSAGDPTAPALARLDGTRRILRLAAPSLAEVKVLEGALVADRLTRDVARLSLRGAAPSVFGLARKLLDELPLSVPACSLTDAARELVNGATPPPPPRLDAAFDVDEAFAHVIVQLTAAIQYHVPGARLGRAVEPVHQMRVALRRLRSAMALFGRVAACPELDRSRQALGELARALGPARDWDVFLGGTGREIKRLLPLDPAVGRLMTGARRRRKAAYSDLARVLDSVAFQRTLLDLSELRMVRPWRVEATHDQTRLVEFAKHTLDRRLRRVASAGAAFDDLPIQELHQLRIVCKRLRYAAEFFSPLMPGKSTRRFLRRLAAVQERLGHLNDGAVATGLLGELSKRGFASGVVQGYLLGRNADTRAKAADSWRKFRRTTAFWQ